MPSRRGSAMLRAAAWQIIQPSAELSSVAVMKKLGTLGHWTGQAAQHTSQSSAPPLTARQPDEGIDFEPHPTQPAPLLRCSMNQIVPTPEPDRKSVGKG